MRKLIQNIVLASIIVMLSGSINADAQNRRTSGSSGQQTTSTSSKSSSSSSSYSRSGNSKSSSTATKSSSSETKKTSSTSSARTSSQSSTRQSDTKASNTQQDRKSSSASQNTSRSSQTVQGQRTSTGTRNNSSSTTDTRRTNGSSATSGHSTVNSNSHSTKSNGGDSQVRQGSTGQGAARRVDPQVKSDAKSAERQVERDAKRLEHQRNEPAPKEERRDYKPAPQHYGSFEHPYMDHDYRPAPFHRVGHHSFGYRLRDLPHGYEIRYIRSVPYYYYDGIYYRSYRNGGYVVVRPPVGSYITTRLLDIALTAVVLNSIENTYDRIIEAQQAKNAQYYYGDGIYYRLNDDRYEVVDAPVGALISRLPEDYDEVSLNGKTYYQVEDVLYKVVIVDGYPFFEVVAIL